MGITFDIEQQKFKFDFEHDGTSDLVTLTGSGYQVEAFGKCFYYGYEFEPEIDSETRTKFIQYVKFSSSIQKDEDLSHFIQKAINDLNAKINLYDYDLVIYPESSSQVNQYMLRYIYRFASLRSEPTKCSFSLPQMPTENSAPLLRTKTFLS